MAQLKVRNKSVAELIDKFIGDGLGMENMLMRMRNSIIVRTLTLTEGNITRAAEMLKTHRGNLERWLREYKVYDECFIAEEIQNREVRNPQLHQK